MTLQDQTSLPANSRKIPWHLIGVIAFLVAAFVFTLGGWVPWRVDYPPGDLDPSWILSLKWAHEHAIDFGTSFVFTYGPYGFALLGYEPDTFGQMVLVWSVFAAAFFFSLVVICRALKFPFWVSAIWIVLMITLFSSDITQDVRMFSLSWMLLIVHFVAKDRWATICKAALLFAMALAGLLKFTMTLLAVGMLGVITLQQLLEISLNPADRRKPMRYLEAFKLPLIFAAAYLALWLLAQQKIGSLWPYIRNSMEISGAYDRTQQAYSTDEGRTVVFFLACAVPLLGVIFIAFWKRWLNASLATFGAAICLFLIFKAGFVRHDGHELHATAGLFLLALLWGFAMWKSLHWIGKTVAVAVVIGSLVFCWRSFSSYAGMGLPREMARAYGEFPARMGTAFSWMAGHCNMRQSYDAQIQAALDRNSHVPQVDNNGIDIYPWGQVLLLARNQDFRPRPVIQSYLAYTPALEQLNADHLRSPDAAHWILFNLGTIDDRYPSTDDALSWPDLFTRYEPRDFADNILLERSNSPRTYQLTPGVDQTAKFGDVIDVPPSDKPLWARLSFHQTRLGKLQETFYKSCPLGMLVQTADGFVVSYQIIPELSRAGFLLSPSVRDPMDFGMLYSRNWQTDLATQMVTHIRILPMNRAGAESNFDKTFHFSFDTLDFPRGDLSRVSGFLPMEQFNYLLRHAQFRDGESKPPLIRLPGRVVGFLINGPRQMLLSAMAPPSSVHVGFGIISQAYLGANPTHGIHFIVYAMHQDGTGAAVWSKLLDPASNPDDQILQSADIPLPAGTFGIVLGTAPVADGPNNLAVWNEATFH